MQAGFKLISSSSIEIFEARLGGFIAELEPDDVVVDVKFSSAAMGQSTQYSTLVHYQKTESWAAEG